MAVKLPIVDVLEHSLTRSAEFACPYLPRRRARSEGFTADSLPGEWYRRLMDHGFRRSGRVIYRPVCRACRQCRQLRVPTATFRRSRSQRRAWRRNADLVVSIEPPKPTAEKWRLFQDYLDARHDGSMSRSSDSFAETFHLSCVESLEVCYRLQDRLVGVSMIDVVPGAWSSVYMYFDPAESVRSLGVYSILWEIEHCRRAGLAYYYLGYYIAASPTMSYKGRFLPHQLLTERHTWESVTAARQGSGFQPRRAIAVQD